jgi:hypothetical protein
LRCTINIHENRRLHSCADQTKRVCLLNTLYKQEGREGRREGGREGGREGRKDRRKEGRKEERKGFKE